ncbi:hypothetical protein ONZ45_g14407 [Pleurotus djamor]|nr:hypothetical protein ONZ45_g14407 [Pleurotus djamor]
MGKRDRSNTFPSSGGASRSKHLRRSKPSASDVDVNPVDPSSNESTEGSQSKDDEDMEESNMDLLFERYPLSCPSCKMTFLAQGGMMSHFHMSKHCSWWRENQRIIADWKNQKAKWKMTAESESSLGGYVLVPELYADCNPPTDNARPWEVMEEMEDDLIFNMIPGVLPAMYETDSQLFSDGQAGPSTSAAAFGVDTASSGGPQVRPRLDDDEDTRWVEQNLDEHGTITGYNVKAVARWRQLFGANPAPNGDEPSSDPMNIVAQVLQQITQNTSTLPALLPAIKSLEARLEGVSKGLEQFAASVNQQNQAHYSKLKQIHCE